MTDGTAIQILQLFLIFWFTVYAHAGRRHRTDPFWHGFIYCFGPPPGGRPSRRAYREASGP